MPNLVARDQMNPKAVFGMLPNIEQTVSSLVVQCVYGLALGYEDLNDHDVLRKDSVLALLIGKQDLTGEARVCGANRGNPPGAARKAHGRTGNPACRFRDFRYRTRRSWSCERRVIGKDEHLLYQANPRIVVTNLSPREARAKRPY